MIQLGANEPDSIILDFFAGSGTTAHAVLAVNAEDGGRRRFVMVQLPEATGRNDFATIADIAKERIRRAAKAIALEKSAELDLKSEGKLDFEFKVLRLARSNFDIWDGEAGAEHDRDLERLVENACRSPF
jgi:adenine-specific DNA-methyltransferase